MARPAARGAVPQSAGVGEARLLSTPPRTTSSSSATTRRTRSRTRRPGGSGIDGLVRVAADADAGRPEGPAATRGDVHLGVLRQPRLPVRHRRGRQRPLGRHAAGAAAAARRRAQAGVRSRVLGRRFRRRPTSATTSASSSASDGPAPARAGHPRPEDHRAVRPQHVARRGDERGEPALLRDERRAAADGARVPAAPDRAGLVRRGQREVADADRGDRPALRGALHGARLRDHPPADARRRLSWTFNTVNHDPPEVGAGQGHAPAQPLLDHGRGMGRADLRGRGADRRRALDDRPARPPSPRWKDGGFAWRFWTFEWGKAAPGVHTIRSRAYDADGNRQPRAG